MLEPARGRGPRARVRPFAMRWDKNPDYKARPPEEEDPNAELGEDKNGVWTTRHPEALLADDPAVGELIDEFYAVSERGLTTQHYAERDSWWTAAWGVALAARQRDDEQRLKNKGKAKTPEGRTRRGKEGQG